MLKDQPSVINMNKKEEETVSKIDAIKNLIFGDNIQAYDTEFEMLKKDILEKKKVLEEMMEEVRTDLHRSIDDISSDVNKRMDTLEDNLETKIDKLEKDVVNQKMLGELLIALGEKFSKK